MNGGGTAAQRQALADARLAPWSRRESTALGPRIDRSVGPPAPRRVEPDPRLAMAHDLFDPRCDRIRALRTELLLRRASPDHADIVALLSPGHGEGRSLLAAELAIAFAQADHPTLLVDADLRQPRQHALFSAPQSPGLAQALVGTEPPLLHAVHGLPQLWLLTAGIAPGDPLDLLSSRRFAAMMESWRERFEFVIVDTAPVTLFSDALAVASLAGRVLALSRAAQTPARAVEEMLRRLGATRARILGAVISHF